MRIIRISLRHTGVPGFRFGVSRGYYSKLHWNIFFGRFFLAIRDKCEDLETYKPKFMDLEFGRAQLKNRRLWDAMTDEEVDLYFNYNPEHLRLEYFLTLIRRIRVMSDEPILIYSFFHRGHLVYVQAVNPDQANEHFQERFGYYPTKENQNVIP